MLFPPVLHNFFEKISANRGNKKYFRWKLCNTGEQHRIRQIGNLYIFLLRNALIDIQI